MNGTLHDFHHLLSNELLMGGLGEAGGLNLLVNSLGESNAEHSEDVAVLGLGLNESLNEGLPLLDHGASLVSGDVHTVEVGVAVESLDLINLELELSPGGGLRLVVAISKRDGENTTSQTVSGVHKTGSLVNWGQGDASFVESWSKNVVPFFLGKWVSTIIKFVRKMFLSCYLVAAMMICY